MTDLALAEALDRRTHGFRKSSVVVSASVLAVIAAITVTALVHAGQPLGLTAFPAGAGLVALVALALALGGDVRRGITCLCYGISAVAAAFLLISTATELHPMGHMALVVMIVVASFLMGGREAYLYGALNVLSVVVVAIDRNWGPEADSTTLISGVGNVLLVLLAVVAAAIVANHFHGHVALLRARLEDIDAVVAQADRIAVGDLSGRVEGDNDVSQVIQGMVSGLRAIVSQVQHGVRILGSAAAELAATATQHQQGVSRQAAAVEETRRTIDAVAESASKIASTTVGVLDNAQATLATNEQVSTSMAGLVAILRRVNELLEQIKDVSNKSEILALNAALEGVKAGAAGTGFSLVATHLQRLAESTMDTVKDVKSLVADIDKATASTVLAVEHATRLAADTTRAAREIAQITEQQRGSAEQIVQAMADVTAVTNEVAGSTQDSLAAADELRELSERLSEAVHRFVL